MKIVIEVRRLLWYFTMDGAGTHGVFSTGLIGGQSVEKKANADVQELCTRMRGDVETKLQRKFQEFVAKTFKSQVVAGMNYFIKVHVGGGEHLHVRIYRPLNGDIMLHSLEEDKAETDEISYF